LLTSIQDLSGQVTTLTYSDASTPASIAPAPGLLITVTSPKGRLLQFVYNASSQIKQITLPDGGTLQYAYDSSGNMTQVTYPDGHTRLYKYDESDNAPADYPSFLTGIIDENGQRYADIHYGANATAGVGAISSQLGGVANLTQVTFPNAYHATVTYPLGVQATVVTTAAPYGRMQVSSNSQACAPSCNQTDASRTYDANGNPASSTDFNGTTTAYTYDDAGLQTQRIEAQGTAVQRTINTQWDTVYRNPTERTVLDASGTLTAKTDWVYNSRGQVTARCEDDPTVSGATGYACSTSGTPPPGVRRWTYTYCAAVGDQCPLIGLLLSVDGPRTDVSDVTQYAYFPHTVTAGCGTPGGACHQAGDLWKVTDALGHVAQYASYDADGRVAEVIDPNGVATTFTYTPRGWLHTRTVAGATTTIDYDAVGDVTKVTEPDGVFTSYSYDTAHRLTDVYDALGNHVHFTLDAAGNRKEEDTYAAGSSTPSRTLSRHFNTLGQLVESLDAYGNSTGYQYDPDGNRTDATDPLGVTMHSSYDALSRLSQTIRNYLGSDPATANTTTQYDYDSHDNVSQVTDPDGLNTVYYHDGLNDLGQLMSPDTGTTNYTYDAAGNRSSRTDARGVITTYTYDALNRLTSINYPNNSLDVQYTYDARPGITGCYLVGRLAKMTDSTGSTRYCYDARGNVVSKTIVISAQNIVGTVGYAYDLADRLMTVTYPVGGSVSYTRDADGRIATVSKSGTPIVTAINYLPFGPATQYTFADGGQTLSKIYDENYRATDVTGSALNLHFKRDAMGDITAEGNAPGVPTPNESYLYDPLYRLKEVDDASGAPWQTYTYDQTGDRLTKVMAGLGTDTYSYQSGTHRLLGISGYDVSNRLVNANGNTTAFQANGWTYGLGYNDTNRLALVQQNGTIIATYGLNGQGERVAKTLAGGGAEAYVYNEAGHLLGEYATGQSRDDVWADGTLVATMDGIAGTVHYIYTDQLGTPRAVTDTTGTLVWDWPYNQNPFGEAPASGNEYTLNVRFPGQYYDQEDGLHYNHFRDYEPGTGRYAQSDPTGLAGGISTYGYSKQQPLDKIDPRGLSFEDWIDCLANQQAAGTPLYCGDVFTQAGLKNQVQHVVSNCAFPRPALPRAFSSQAFCAVAR
jgi:RHS repeat-associated protein